MKDREFRAQKFVLVDDEDRPRAELSIVDGAVALSLGDANREMRLSLIVDKKGEPSIRLCGEDGRPRAVVILSNGHPRVGLHDSAGTARIFLGVTANDEPIVALHDKTGKRRASLALGFDGAPGLVFADSGGVPVYRIPE
jgi:hypothetical protein